MASFKKNDRRDRYDRIFLKNLDAMHIIMPHLMPKRCDNEAVLEETVDLTAINDYLAKKNAGTPEFKHTWFHVISAALAKTILLRPKMNWFISGDRLYERRDIVLAFNVKKQFSDHGEEAIAKFILDRNGGSPIVQFHDYVRDIVTKVRVKVSVRARMLKEFKVDTTDWTFIVEGSTGTFEIEVITTGERLGQIVLGENVKLNGKELTLGEGDTVSWAVPETGASGTVNASFITSDATRITIARDGLQELFDAENDGKTVVFTVKIGNKRSVKAATMKYVG